MLFLDGVADRAPLHILFAICKRYFFGDNGIAVLEIVLDVAVPGYLNERHKFVPPKLNFLWLI